MALAYFWIGLVFFGGVVAAFQNMTRSIQLNLATYNYLINLFVTGTFLFISEWRLGKKYGVSAPWAKPPLFAICLAYNYYYRNQKTMYLESYMVSFLFFLILIPLVKYGPGWIPKRPSHMVKRLPPIIK